MNGTKQNPEINLWLYSQLVFYKGDKAIQWGERIVLSTDGARSGYPYRNNEVQASLSYTIHKN